MKFSSLTDRISGKSVDSWEVHYQAMARLANGEDIFLLSVGQESYEFTDERIVDSAIDSLKSGRHHYTPVEGELALRTIIAKQHQAKTGQKVSAENCVIFIGAQNGLFATAQCLLESGDEVIVPEPYYTTYPASFTCTGATFKSIPCLKGDNFQVNVEGILVAITPKTRAIVLNSLNNPTGALYEKNRIEDIVNTCIEHNIWLICDDVYADLVDPSDLFLPASVPGADKVVITISSLSKSHRMTGWRLGWAVAPIELAQHYYNINMCMNYGLVGFIQDAAITALSLSEDITPNIRDGINEKRKVLEENLLKIDGIKIITSQAGMFVMIDISHLEISGQDFCKALLDQYNVSLIPCDGFGATGVGLLRVSACDSPDRLKEACNRISKFVKSITQCD